MVWLWWCGVRMQAEALVPQPAFSILHQPIRFVCPFIYIYIYIYIYNRHTYCAGTDENNEGALKM